MVRWSPSASCLPSGHLAAYCGDRPGSRRRTRGHSGHPRVGRTPRRSLARRVRLSGPPVAQGRVRCGRRGHGGPGRAGRMHREELALRARWRGGTRSWLDRAGLQVGRDWCWPASCVAAVQSGPGRPPGRPRPTAAGSGCCAGLDRRPLEAGGVALMVLSARRRAGAACAAIGGPPRPLERAPGSVDLPASPDLGLRLPAAAAGPPAHRTRHRVRRPRPSSESLPRGIRRALSDRCPGLLRPTGAQGGGDPRAGGGTRPPAGPGRRGPAGAPDRGTQAPPARPSRVRARGAQERLGRGCCRHGGHSAGPAPAPGRIRHRCERVTAELSAAQEIGDRTERLLQAGQEIERVLRTTPVLPGS